MEMCIIYAARLGPMGVIATGGRGCKVYGPYIYLFRSSCYCSSKKYYRQSVYYNYLSSNVEMYRSEGYELSEGCMYAQRCSPPNSASGGPEGSPALWDLAH